MAAVCEHCDTGNLRARYRMCTNPNHTNHCSDKCATDNGCALTSALARRSELNFFTTGAGAGAGWAAVRAEAAAGGAGELAACEAADARFPAYAAARRAAAERAAAARRWRA